MNIVRFFSIVGVLAILVACTSTEPEERATTYQSEHLTATMGEDNSLMVGAPEHTVQDAGLVPFLFGSTAEIMSITTSDSSLVGIDGFEAVIAPNEGSVTLTATYRDGSIRSYVLILRRINGIGAGVAQ